MLIPLSQTELAHRDTLIAKSFSVAMDRLGELYGLPRIPRIPRVFWQDVLAAAALGPRDRITTIHSVLKAIMGPWSSLLITAVDLQVAQPSKLVGGTPGGVAWSCTHEHRLIEVGGTDTWKGVYWSTGVNGADLDLAAVGTSYWRGANWTANESGIPVRVLPFWLREDGAVVRIYLDAELFSVPPTYLQPEADEDPSVVLGVHVPRPPLPRPGGQPLGGALLSSGAISAPAAFEGPLYLPGDGLRGLLQVLLDSLCAAGVKLGLYTLEWCAASSLGIGSLEDLGLYGRAVGGTDPIEAPIFGWSP